MFKRRTRVLTFSEWSPYGISSFIISCGFEEVRDTDTDLLGKVGVVLKTYQGTLRASLGLLVVLFNHHFVYLGKSALARRRADKRHLILIAAVVTYFHDGRFW